MLTEGRTPFGGSVGLGSKADHGKADNPQGYKLGGTLTDKRGGTEPEPTNRIIEADS